MTTQLFNLTFTSDINADVNKQTLIDQIKDLAQQRNAIILAHNYQMADVQDVADVTGDSLGLALEAQKTDADLIVFCGVHFMAESAKILNPEKKVLLPNLSAGCSLADSITAESLEDWKRRYPDHAVVTAALVQAGVVLLSRRKGRTHAASATRARR